MLIKERCGHHHVIRSNHYGHRLSFFEELFAAARVDIPTLAPDDVEVVQFGGIRYKRTWGIRFTHTPGHPAYSETRELECEL